MKTEAIITLSLAPPDSKSQVSGIALGTAQETVALTDSNTFYTKRITGEPDLVRLDGSYQFYESPSDCCYSTVMSGADGSFYSGVSAVSMDIFFSELQKSRGVTLYFGDTCVADFTVDWYQGSTKQASKAVIQNKSNPCAAVLDQDVEYDSIRIFFHKTDKPYRYLKLTEIDFGEDCVFSGQNLKSAKMLDEFDYLANELSIGRLTFEVLNKDQDFNLLNENGLYYRLRNNQEVRCDMRIQAEDGTEKEIRKGVFYLSDWENTNAPTAKLEAQSALSRFDRISYIGSPYYIAEKASTFFKDVFQTAGIYNYDLPDWMDEEQIGGFIPEGTVRTALQQLCVATRTALRIDSAGKVLVYRPDITAMPRKGLAGMLGNEKISQKTEETGISVEWFSILQTPLELYKSIEVSEAEGYQSYHIDFNNEVVSENENREEGSEAKIDYFLPSSDKNDYSCMYVPVHSTWTTFDIKAIKPGINHVWFQAAKSNGFNGLAYVRFSGQSLTVNKYMYVDGDQKIQGNTLITSENQAKQIAEYWSGFVNRYAISAELKAIISPPFIIDVDTDPELLDISVFDYLNAGDCATISTAVGKQMDVHVTSVETDLTGGMVATIKGIASKEDIHVDTTEN